MSILFITHNMGVVAEIAHKVAVMYRTDRRNGARRGIIRAQGIPIRVVCCAFRAADKRN